MGAVRSATVTVRTRHARPVGSAATTGPRSGLEESGRCRSTTGHATVATTRHSPRPMWLRPGRLPCCWARPTWSGTGGRSPRSGRGRPVGWTPRARRASAPLEAGGITAWRSLAEAGSPRTAWFEVVPYASPADAELSLRQVPRFFVGTDRPDETVVAERVVDDQVLPGSTDTWIYEKSTTGPRGDGLARYVGGTVDHILFLTCFTGPEETWSWADVLTLTALQVERIRLALDRRVRSGRAGGVRPITRGRRTGPGRHARARPDGGGDRGGGWASRSGPRPSA